MTVSPSITIGELSDPWNVSPILLVSELRGSFSRTDSCVPAGTVTFCGGGGGGGGEGGVGCASGCGATGAGGGMLFARVASLVV